MSSIDERIVQMQFENSQFEKGVKESLKSLEQLKEGLQLEKAAEGLKRLQEAGDHFSLAKVGEGVDGLQERFSAFGTFAARIIENLADTVYNKLGSAIESVTVGQISAGWQKYAEDTQAVQTIMFATGKSIQEVEAELKKLTWFTDETSYSYADMVSNIGKFTSNNIDLTDARTSMQGIAVWAASAGQNAATASRAMYNISQAMGVGAMKVMDWKSIELANMATTDFKKNAIQTAIALGKLDQNAVFAETLASGKVKKTQVTVENFRDTLNTGWFDKEVMLKVFGDYGEFAEKVQALVEETGMSTSEAIEQLSGTTNLFSENAFKAAQEAKTFAEAIEALRDATSTKWLNIFKLIFGNYEQAKELWTKLANDLYEIFVDPLDTLVETLEEWHKTTDENGHELSNTWGDFMQGVYDIMDGLKGILITIRDAFENLIPGITVTDLRALAKGVKEFGASFKAAFGLPEEAEKVAEVVDGVTESVKGAKEVVDGVTGTSTRNIKYLKAEAVELNHELQKGATGKEVKKMQEQLIGAGYSLDKFGADGIWGPETQAAWEAFCKDAGLGIDSVFDAAAAQSLADAFNLKKTQEEFEDLSKTLKLGDKGDEVKKLQERLLALGFNLDKYGADGIWGPETQAAYEEFCKVYGLDPNDAYDQKAHLAMRTALGYDDAIEAAETLIEKNKEAKDAIEKYPDSLNRIKMIAGGIFAVGGIILKVVGAIGKALAYIWELSAPVRDAFMIAAASIGEALIRFNKWLGTSGAIDKWFSKIKKDLEPFGKWMQTAADSFLLFFGLKKPASDSNKEIFTFSKLWKSMVDNLKKTAIFKNITSAFNTIREALNKVSPTVKGTFKTFKQNLGQTFLKILKGVGTVLMILVAPIGVVINLLSKLVGFVIEQIPKGVKILKDLWGALTFEGDASLGKAPGILAKAKSFVDNIRSFLFGKSEVDKEGNGTGKDGIFARISAFINGDLTTFTKGLSGEAAAKAIAFSEKVKGIYNTIKENIEKAYSAISYLFTGQLENAGGLSFDSIQRIDDIRLFFSKVGEALNFLFTGKESDESLLSEKTKTNIKNFRTNVLGTITNIRNTIKQIAEGLVYLFTSKTGDNTTLSKDQIDRIDKFRENVNYILDCVSLLFTGNKRDGGLLLDDRQVAILQFRDTVLGYFETIKGVFSQIGSTLVYLFTGTNNGLVPSDWVDRVDWFKGKVIDIFGNIGNSFAKIWPTIRLLFTGDAANSTLEKDDIDRVMGWRDSVIGFFNGIGEAFQKVWAAAQYLFTGKGPDGVLSQDTISTIQSFRDGIVSIFKTVSDIFVNIWTDLKDIFKDGVNFKSIKEALVTISENVGEFFKTLWKSASSLLKWGLVIFAVYKIAMLIGNISGAFGSLKDVINSYKKNTQALSKSILEFAAAVAIIAASIWAIGQLKPEQFKQGLTAVGGIIVAIVALITLSKFFLKKDTAKSIKNIGQSIWDFAKAIGVLTGTVLLLSIIPWKTFLNGLAKVGILCVLMIGVIKKLNKFGSTNIKMTGLVGMAAAIGILAIIVGLLGRYKWKTIGKGLASLLGVVIILRGLMKTMGKWGATNIKMKGLIGLSIAVGLMAIIVGQFGKMKAKVLAKGLAALYAITFILRRTMTSINDVKSPSIGGLLAALVSIGLIMAGLVVALKYVKDINPKAIAAFTVGLAAVIAAAGLFAKLSGGATFTGVTAAAVGILEVIVVIGLICAAFAELRKIPGFQEFMESGAESIGRILGTLVASFAGTVISQFGKSVGALSDLPTADPKATENAVACAEQLKTFAEGLPQKDTVTKIVDFIVGSEFAQFSRDMGEFGKGFNNFATELGKVETFENLETNTNSAISIASAIAAFAQTLPEKDNATKVVERFTGSELAQFARDMGTFGTEFNRYAAQLSSIETTKDLFTKTVVALTIANSIAAFAKALPEKDNATKVVERFTGSELAQFARDMGTFGTEFNEYANELNSIKTVKGLKAKSVAAVAIAKSISAFAQTLPEKDNLTKIVDSAFGSELAQFSEDMSGFAEHFNKFQDEIIKVDEKAGLDKKAAAAVQIAGIIRDFTGTLENIGNVDKVFSALFGTDTSFFNSDMSGFGASFNEFANEISKIKSTDKLIDDTKAAIQVAQAIASFINYLSSDEFTMDSVYITDWGGQMSSFEILLGKLRTLGEKIKEFDQQVDGIDIYSIGYTIKAITNFLKFLSSESQIGSGEILSGLTSDAISSRFTEIITGINNAISSKGDSLIEIGSSMSDEILVGLSGGDTSKAGELVSNMISALNKYYEDFKTAGKNFALGISGGVYFKAKFAIEAARYVAQSMVNKLREVFDTHSPSKVTNEIGRYFTEGLAGGVSDRETQAISSTQDVAESMLATAKGTLTNLTDLLMQDVDMEPVIAPVVDLTGARQAAGSIETLFGPQSTGLSMTKTLISKADIDADGLQIKQPRELQSENMNLLRSDINSMRRGIDGMSPDSVVSEIQNLTDKFADLAEAVTNMRLVLDTGVLVGETSSLYDRQFGSAAIMRERGN